MTEERSEKKGSSFITETHDKICFKYCPNRIKNRAYQFAVHLRVQNRYQEVEIHMGDSPKMLLFYKILHNKN